MSRDRVVEYTFVRGINRITQPRETYFNVIVYSTVLQTRTLLL